MRHLRIITMTAFGVSVMTSGLWRFFTAEGGHNGLWFGLVMGGLALISAALFYVSKTTTAAILATVSLIAVGGWFVYEALIKKGFENAELRQILIIAATLVTASLLLVSARPPRDAFQK